MQFENRWLNLERVELELENQGGCVFFDLCKWERPTKSKEDDEGEEEEKSGHAYSESLMSTYKFSQG